MRFANLAKEPDCAACDRPQWGSPGGRRDFDPPILKTGDEADQFRPPIAGAVDVLTSRRPEVELPT